MANNIKYEETDLVFEGDEELTKIKYDRKFSKEQLQYWFGEMKKTCPTVPDGVLLRVLDLYSTNPNILSDIVAEHKENPNKFVKDEPLKFEIDD